MMKKPTKMLAVLAAGLALSISVVSCKKETKPTEKEKVEKEVKKEVKKVVKNKGQMEGTLISFEGKTLEVKEADKQYSFDVSKAKINTLNMRSGDELIIYYDGRLKGTNTSRIKVTHVEDRGNNQQQTEKQAVGTLVNFSENTITIRQNDGTELLFSANNCKHEFKNGLREGNWIVVTYIGEIQGTDTKNVTVLKITDNDPNVIEAEHRKINIRAVDEIVYTTAGVHIRELYTTDSQVLASLAKGDSIKRTGVCDNGWSRVQFEDRDAYIYGDYLTTEKPEKNAPAAQTSGEPPVTLQQGNKPYPVQAIRPVQQSYPQKHQPPQTQTPPETLTEQPLETQAPQTQESQEPLVSQPEKPQETQAPQPEESLETQTPQPEKPQETQAPQPEESPETQAPQPTEPLTLTGTVLDVSMNTLTLHTDSSEYTFNIMDAEHQYANGIQRGNTVIVTYIGDLSDPENIIVSKVQDSDPNEAAAKAEYVGTIVDGTMNTLTIRTEDGGTMTFSKDNAVDNTDGDLIDTNVKIICDMTASKTEENIFRATQIDYNN